MTNQFSPEFVANVGTKENVDTNTKKLNERTGIEHLVIGEIAQNFLIGTWHRRNLFTGR